MIHAENERLVGYARASTNEQELDLQIDALRAHGVRKENLFSDKRSGAKEDRPGLMACNKSLRPGDTLVVWRLDRLGRSMRHLVNMIEDLKARGIGFRSIADGMIDTTSASGELVLNIFSALAQFERRLIQERTKAGLAAARSRGRRGGRPAVHRYSPKVVLANKLYCDPSVCLDDICSTLKISKSTLYRYVSMHGNWGVRSKGRWGCLLVQYQVHYLCSGGRAMPRVAIRAVLVWLVIIAVESVHGILRTILLAPLVGDFSARQVSVFTGSLLIFVVALLSTRWMGAESTRQQLGVGCLWVALTVLFEIGLGRWVMGLAWARLAEDYDLTHGGLLGLGLLFMGFTPWLVARVRGTERSHVEDRPGGKAPPPGN